jgi:hypothetical protein
VGVQRLCETGLGQDAAALMRVLLETSLIVLFILQKDGPTRARRYLAHLHVKTLRDAVLQNAPPDRIAAKKAMLEDLALRLGEKASVLQKDLKDQWWPGGLLKIAQNLNWERVYQVVYRRASDAAHALDAWDHVEMTDRGTIGVKVIPGDAFVKAVSGTASQILWSVSEKINESLRLGQDERVAQSQPPGA